MPPIINFKICDNSADCNGISKCPCNVFYWDEQVRTIKIDESKCIECGECTDFCSIDAIKYASNETERKAIQKEIDEDPRVATDLFVDRYGATLIDDTYTFEPTPEKIKNRITSNRPVVIEYNQEATIECLLKSIRVSEIIDAFHKDATYSKFYIEEKDFALYGVTTTPCLRFYYNNKILGQIDEYFKRDECDKYLKIISEFGEKIQ